ncbi:LppP/LprE lipoprotein [Gordonia malaquae]|nr:LppP/LprE family lipoprotein [Gordonia malaquae]SEB69252.1 LppP/LprE lipoprotein [Gordonia malaquae]
MTRTRIGAVLACVLLVGAGLTACGDDSSHDPSSPQATATGTASDTTSAAAAPDPCPPNRNGACTPLAVVDMDGSGEPASLSLHPIGTKLVTLTTPTETYVSPEIAPASVRLTRPKSSSEIADGIAYYELDGRPGAEIVVPIGMMGSNSVFQVFTFRNGELISVGAPGDTYQMNLGSSFWVFPGEGILARAMCRDGGLSLGSTEMPTPKQGHVIDFVSETSTGAGEASEWVVSGRRTVTPSEITDMSIGQTHFKCKDVRIKSLTGATTSAATTTSCDSSKDMSDAVRTAVLGLSTKNGWQWQADNADVSSLDPCKTLSFATTTIEMATNSSPVAILLFNKGKFVGPASTCFPPIKDVTSSGDDTVTVTYRYPNEGDTNAGMTGRATLTFRWDGSKVVKTGDVPARLTQLAGCAP